MLLKDKSLKSGVSIVIVTCNGGERLIPTLKHIAIQKDIDFDLEVVLVNNNSTDNTVTIAQKVWQESGTPFPLQIVLEEKPGTMYARKKGIEMSQYRYMLYCDDDNWLNSSYIFTAYSIISSSEGIAAVGGCGEMQYETGFVPPFWISDYEYNFGTSPQGKNDGDTTNDKGCLYTAGTIFDRKWLYKLYKMGFESALQGRDGKTLIAGEDTELTYALKLIGAKLYYSSKMQFQHYMPKERIHWEYLKRLWASFGYSEYVISPYNNYFNKRKLPLRYVQFFKTVKAIMVLSYIIYKNNYGEGDRKVLVLEKQKGRLRAILFATKQKKIVTQTIQRLSTDK